MRKIILVRHGESADKQAGQTDFERVLTDRGQHSIRQLGKCFNQENIFPNHIFSSPVIRAKQTAALIAEVINFLDPIEYEDSLNIGSDSDYLDIITNAAGTLIIVGHNPTISFVTGKLVGYSTSLLPGQACIVEMDDGNVKDLRAGIAQLVGPFHK